MANYEESRVKLPNTQLNDIKICNNKQQLLEQHYQKPTLRITKKSFQD